MALELFIPPCINIPPHNLHPPPPDKPLRIRIQGPLESIQKLLPTISWNTIGPFPQPGGEELARLTHERLYAHQRSTSQQPCSSPTLDNTNGREKTDNSGPVVRDEYLAWAMEGRQPLDHIDYYGVTFDHLVPADDLDPDVLAINIIEVDKDDGGGVYADGGVYANQVLRFRVDPADYTGKRVLAVPRCCQHKKGTQDRGRINSEVIERDSEIEARKCKT